MTDSGGSGIVLTVLTELYEDKGYLTPQLVVEEAKAPDHPLHHRFTWDDAEAARRHRLNEAAGLIRSVHLTIIEPELEETKVRAFVSVPTPYASGPGQYRPQHEVAMDPKLREVVIRQMDLDWRRFRARYQHLREFWDLLYTVSTETPPNGGDTPTPTEATGS